MLSIWVKFVATLKALLQEIAASRKGVKPSFEAVHVIKTFLILYENEPMGRNTLSKMLGLSITSTRTLIRRMREWSLVNVDVIGGCYLTERGREVATKILNTVPKVCDVSKVLGEDLRLAGYAWASLIRHGVPLIEKIGIINVRDRVIAYGSKAALIVFISNGQAYIPPDYSLNEMKYGSLKRLREFLVASDKDAILVSFSEDVTKAERALLNVIIDLFLDS
jgi:hypothetical protein